MAGLPAVNKIPLLKSYDTMEANTLGPVMYFGQFSLENFLRVFTIAPRPIVNSFFLATTAAIIGIVFGMWMFSPPAISRIPKIPQLSD